MELLNVTMILDNDTVFFPKFTNVLFTDFYK